MNNINIFCFGFGQVAKTFINKIKLENFKINLSTTSRNKTSEKNIYGISYKDYFFKDESYDDDLIQKVINADHVLVSIPPNNGTDIVIKNFSKTLQECKAKSITYLSATSVYGDHGGEWVNEKSETKPTSNSGLSRLAAERAWLLMADVKKIPLQIFRLSGIYSNDNNVLSRLKLGNIRLIDKKNHFFSRIHVEDVSNVLFKSLFKFKALEIYNISDDQPATSKEVLLYGAKILKIEPPKKITVDQIQSEMLRNFYKDSKKVSNKKMKNYFNYSLKFPSYIDGLNDIRNQFV